MCVCDRTVTRIVKFRAEETEAPIHTKSTEQSSTAAAAVITMVFTAVSLDFVSPAGLWAHHDVLVYRSGKFVVLMGFYIEALFSHFDLERYLAEFFFITTTERRHGKKRWHHLPEKLPNVIWKCVYFLKFLCHVYTNILYEICVFGTVRQAARSNYDHPGTPTFLQLYCIITIRLQLVKTSEVW